MVDGEWNRSYVLSTQSSITGGFSKWPDCHPGERKGRGLAYQACKALASRDVDLDCKALHQGRLT